MGRKLERKESNMKSKVLQIGTSSIQERSDGLVSLTDIWKAANTNNMTTGKLDPRKWSQKPMAKTSGSTGKVSISGGPGNEFINKVAELHNVNAADIIVSTKGKGGGTFAHWQIALAYAKYLSPALHMQVNEIFMRVQSSDPTLVGEMAERANPEQLKTMQARVNGIPVRKDFTSTLASHDVHGAGFGMCTNAIYQPIIGGTATEVKKTRNLPVKSNLRAHLSSAELIMTSMAELIASRDIEATRTRGNDPCAAVCHRAAQKVAAL